MNDHKGLVLLLLPLVLAIWGYNVYLISRGLPVSAPGPERLAAYSPAPPDRRADFTYIGDFRDPFGEALADAPPPPSQPHTEPAASDPPSLWVVGIVGGTAILGLPDGTTHVAARGADLAGATVRDVSADRVTISYAGRSYVLPLSP